MNLNTNKIMEENQSFKLHSEEIKQIASALSKAAALITPAIKKTENSFFKKPYAELKEIDHSIREALVKNNLAISQVIMPISAMPHLVTILMHESGEWIKSFYPITYDKTTPQAIGSGVTYARRYSLAAICNVVTEDDDGEAATKREKEIPKKAQPHTPDMVVKREYLDEQIRAAQKSAKELFIDRMNNAGDLKELQSIVSEAPAEFINDKFNEYVKKLESKFVEAMSKEIFDLEPKEVKPTFEETAIKHSKTLKPKGAK